LFKDLGRPEDARNILAEYLKVRGEEKDLFDFDKVFFYGDPIDDDVQTAFIAQLGKFSAAADFVGLLALSTDDYSDNILKPLAAASVDEYYKAFKTHWGEELKKILSASLQFSRVHNTSPAMAEIDQKARAALRKIGLESAINARRVSAYGIDLTPSDDAGPEVC